MKNENMPKLWNYGDYSSGNYGAHTMAMDIPPSGKNKKGITLYFSYKELVAFKGYIGENCRGLFVIKNYWGTTTGKHLNFIDGGDKKTRLNESDFIKLFRKALKNA